MRRFGQAVSALPILLRLLPGFAGDECEADDLVACVGVLLPSRHQLALETFVRKPSNDVKPI